MAKKIKINLPTSANCMSCNNCVISCRHGAIELKYDFLGRTYPKINPQVCIECRMCERNCPENNKDADNLFHNPIKCYAVKAQKDVLFNSSSGGVASVLSEKAINDGWIVVGAAFDNFPTCRHIIVKDIDALKRLQKSKYVYSNLNDVLLKIKEHIKKGKDSKVLFFGVPCQIAAAKKYLKNNDNILYVDILCHGTMPDFIFPKYIRGIERKFKVTGTDYLFRGDKNDRDYIVFHQPKLITSTKSEVKLIKWNKWFLTSFLKGKAYKSKCYKCNYAGLARTGDLTIGDFWGLGKETEFNYTQNDGVSVVLVNTKLGSNTINNIKNIFDVFEEREITEAIPQNQTLSIPTPKPHLNSFYLFLMKFCPTSFLLRFHSIMFYFDRLSFSLSWRIKNIVKK